MFHVEHWLSFFLVRWVGLRAGGAGLERFFAGLSSLLRTKREPEKCPLLSRRGRHEKGAARPFQTPKGKSKRKKASRFAKRFFLVSPIYGFAEGVTPLLTVKFC